ncbi:outer membrane protein assembly factor BamE [Halioxenophilus sp. WMMB6]|uniref:outer membrane protein assembly factor BamE domain-containing protein n=1 Tax=Halioxenophilus sp. WMMB6 TaxID=3073815 RepID=UPI00295E4F71|nr:outer membrane protein assembly factor BamE [Halioxenophilus sp. WMMB6]
MKNLLPLTLAALLLGGCTSAAQHAQDVGIDNGEQLTVGTVQKEIKIGMSGAQVAEVLGSPNIVSTDEQRREVWVYDKVATDTVTSSSNSWVFLVLAGGNTSAKARSTTQRTLTIIIKFDENNLVRDFAYHSSKF